MAPYIVFLPLIVAFLTVGVAYAVRRLMIGGREFVRLSGKMLITCPETHQPAAVNVARGRAAVNAMFGKEHVELSQCSRWPEREDCDQACLEELKSDPKEHNVWTIASRWYRGKICVYCGRPISELRHLDNSPGLIDSGGNLVEWDTVKPEKLPAELGSSRPVCWNCNIVQGFRKAYPDLVVERPWEH